MSTSYLTSVIKQFGYYRTLGESAMEQVPEEGLFWQPDTESNSIAVIVNHLAGNMRSRFTDFLTADVEKPWRNRDAEFVPRFVSRQDLLAYWDQGWSSLFDALSGIGEGQLEEIVYIRNEGHTVIEALNRQLAHYAYHVGQIVYLARMLRGAEWTSLSIPRYQSDVYNAHKFGQDKAIKHFTEEVSVTDKNQRKDGPN
jgi:hypothetical protein